MKLTKQAKNLMQPVKTIILQNGSVPVEVAIRQLNGKMRQERITTICELRGLGTDVEALKDNPEAAVKGLSMDAILCLQGMRDKLVTFSIIDKPEGSSEWVSVYETVDEMRDSMPDELIEAVWDEVLSFNGMDEKSKEEIKADFPKSQS